MALLPRFPRRTPATEADPADDFEFGGASTAAPARASDLRPIQLRDWEIPGGYAVAALLAIIAVLELTVTKGKGAPKTHSDLLPVVGLVLAAVQAVTVRFGNRLVTGLLGLFAGFVVFDAKVPHSLSVPKFLGFAIPALYGFTVLQRHSIATRAAQGPRRGRQGAPAARRGRNARPEPTGPPASRRYTPPKPKDEQTRKR